MIAVSTITPKISMSVRRNPEALKALKKEYAEKELLFYQQTVGCYFLSTIKSIMNNLNAVAGKTGNQKLNAREWLNGLTVKDTKTKLAEVFLPYLKKKVIVDMSHPYNDFGSLSEVALAKGNTKLQPLEYAYALYRKALDGRFKDVKNVQKAMSGGSPSLVMRDLGLKSAELSSRYAVSTTTGKERELLLEKFRKYTGKLFEKVKNDPGSIVVTLSTKEKGNANFLIYNHTYSLKRVENDGLIILNPYDTSFEQKISLDEFNEHFDVVDFARLRPEKLFNQVKEAKNAIGKLPSEVTDLTFDNVFNNNSTIEKIRNSASSTVKGKLYYNVEDNITK